MANIIHDGDEYIVEGYIGAQKQSSDPTSITDVGFVFCKDIGHINLDLFYESNGVVVQLTDGSSISSPSKIEWGNSNVTVESSGGDVTLDTDGTLRIGISSIGDIDIDANKLDIDADDIIGITSNKNNAVFADDINIETTGAKSRVKISSSDLLHMYGNEGYTVYTNLVPVERLDIDPVGEFSLTGAGYTSTMTGTINIHAHSGDANKCSVYMGDDYYEISTMGTAGIQLTSSNRFDLVASGQVHISSSLDSATTIESILIETLTSLNGGDIKVNAAGGVDIEGGSVVATASGSLGLQYDTSFYVRDTNPFGTIIYVDAFKNWTVDSTDYTHTATGDYTFNANGTSDVNYTIDSDHGIVISSDESSKKAIRIVSTSAAGAGIEVSSANEMVLTSSSADMDVNVGANWDVDIVGNADINAGGYFRAYSNLIQRLDIGTTGDWNVDGAAYDADFSGIVDITSTFDADANYAINLKTTGTTTGGIGIDSATNFEIDANYYSLDINGTRRNQISSGGATVQTASTYQMTTSSGYTLISGDAVSITSGGGADITLDSDDDVFIVADDHIYLRTGVSEITHMSISSSGSFDVNCYGWDLDADYTINLTSSYAPLSSTNVVQLHTTDSNANIDLSSSGHLTMDSGTGKSTIIDGGASVYVRVAGSNKALFNSSAVYIYGLTSAAVPDLGISGNRLYVDTSSRQWKKDIFDVDDMVTSSEKIFDLRPVRYRRKESLLPTNEDLTNEERAMETETLQHESERYFYGFIAEEVDEIMPEFVMYDTVTGKPQSLKYNWMVVPLLMELKKLRDRVAILENN